MRFCVELLASLDAGVVGRIFAARLLDIVFEGVELAQLAGDGGVERRQAPRRRLLPGHRLCRYLGHAIKRGERHKQRTGKDRQAAGLKQTQDLTRTRTGRELAR